MSYSEPIYQTIVAPTNAALSTAADIFLSQGPVGKKGRIVHVSITMTTANTTAIGGLDFGTVADDDAYGTLNIASDQADNTAVVATKAQLAAFVTLPADTVFLISGDGLGTAGVADISVTIAWF